MDLDELLTSAGREIRSYLARSVGKDAHAEPTTSAIIAELGATVGRVVGILLEDREDWSRYWWVDSVIPERIVLDEASGAIELQGVLIWGDERNQWQEPLLGVVRLSQNSFGSDSYKLAFGDSNLGLGKLRWGERRSRTWYGVSNWIFTFTLEHLAGR